MKAHSEKALIFDVRDNSGSYYYDGRADAYTVALAHSVTFSDARTDSCPRIYRTSIRRSMVQRIC